MKARWLARCAGGGGRRGRPRRPAPRAAALTAAASRPVARSSPSPAGGRGVRQDQQLLNRHGYGCPSPFYGTLTVRQVRRFQVAHGIRTPARSRPSPGPCCSAERPPAGCPAGRGVPADPDLRQPRAALRQAQSLLNATAIGCR